MGQIYQSGAFVQQCFAVHPLCLNVKRLDDTDRLILSCTNCKLAHRLTLRDVAARGPTMPSESGTPVRATAPVAPREQLVACVAGHASALSIRALDVVAEAISLRCAECRWLFECTVPTVETHQK